MADYRFTVVFEADEDGAIVATCPALPGCSSYGLTREEAVANIREAMELAMEDLLRSGKAIPLDTVSAEAIDIAV
jgi:predicted RNase H-like HicB family nuclease